MYLKKLELCGFKSFADKTTLTFERGVSAIIGPNGCGKSNISDSIRWCLGEKRTKSMRTKAMQDVIFGGTKTRSAAGMAEVTLVFDNSQNMIPIDYSEVAITRKLFRSGESEYFINKTQCRLKDIIDLFLDTGIGTGGYSIIEQNKVEELVMANPETRREFFEEAAGVAKYKVRREDTLHRLKNIEIDLSRLEDSLKIFEGQIKQLDQQAKKAKQCKKYKEDLAKYEIAEVVNNLARGYQELEKLKAQIEPKVREYETTNVTLHQLEAEQQDLRLAQTENNEKYISLNSEYSDLKTESALADAKIKNLQQKDADLIQEQDRLRVEIEDAQEKILKYEEDLKNVNTADDGIEAEVAGLKQETEQKFEKYNLIKQQVTDLETQEDQSRTKLDYIDQKKNTLINSKTSIIQEQAEAAATVSSIGRNIERLNNDVAPANQEIASFEQKLQEAQNSLKEIETKVEASKQVVLNIDTEIESLKDKEIEYNKEIAGLESKISTIKEMDAENPIKAAINAVKSLGYIKYSVGEIISPDLDRIDIVANALGDKIDYLICDTMQQAEDAIKYLLDNNLCKLSFLVSENIPKDITVQKSTDSAVEAVELFKMLNCLPEYENVGKFISDGIFVNNDKIYSKAVVSGGAKNVSDKPVLVEEQIKKIQQTIEKTKQELENLSKEIDNKEDTKLNISFEDRDNNNLKIRIGAQIENLQETIKQRKADISDTATEIENLQKEKIEKQQILNTVNEKIADIDQQLSDMETESVTLNETLSKIEQEIDALRNQEEQANQEYIDISNNYERRKSDLEHRATGQKYITDNIDNLKSQIEQKTNRTAEIETELQNIQTNQETETSNIQKYSETMTQKETELQIVIGDRDRIQGEIDAKETVISETRTKVAQLNDEVNSLQSDQRSYNTQKDILEAQIKETYGKTYEEIKDQYIGVEVDKEEIARLKKKIESFGAINWSAEEEYESLSQRYDFIQSQQKDLLKAKQDLEETIKKINETTIVNFKKTFDAVRENFRTLYKKVFGGGDADLILTDENNLLESGVDIKAQPPGKNVKNIMQCSGGEKAFTAVALLFSFFMVKPSPFCILDEVDAPFDDANVGRYNNIIREFAQKTQFMVVTHNKRTMEMADTLYGVTMEQQGVSKIISVRMNKDSEKEIDQILSTKQ
ncbi:chromosome segregation protein SMC [Candidatus Ruminimicrobiellum ovillum]|uniref:chromosome segregation protein SMC n=1 Tax=Candidatus Ruminimicrobiellum ovillum TaxID=1947927 RepID=UPI00355A7550